MKTLQKSLFLVLAISLLCSCSTNAPFKTLYYSAEENVSQKGMIIFLRGRGGSHEDFATDGFIDDIRARKLPYDIAAPNAHLGYYIGETLVPRLKADIIEPARAKGYSKFWLVGFSMGGLGALMYTRQHPEDVYGVYVISPFLGYDKIIREIKDAGGVSQWNPGEYDPDDDWERMFWHWLKQHAEDMQLLSIIYLGYGTEDSFTQAQGLLEDLLPHDNVFKTPGGHTPKTMQKLWRIFLEQDGLY